MVTGKAQRRDFKLEVALVVIIGTEAEKSKLLVPNLQLSSIILPLKKHREIHIAFLSLWLKQV